MKLLLALFLALSASAQVAPRILTYTVHVSSGNVSVDLNGAPDTRGPCCWGFTDVATWSIVFQPPAGYNVRVLKIQGDLSGMPKHITPEPVLANAYAGLLIGFSTTAPSGSVNCPVYCADNTPQYRQVFVQDGAPFNSPFLYDYGVDGILLQPDNTLVLKVASYEDTLGVPIHTEATYTFTYVYVPAQQ